MNPKKAKLGAPHQRQSRRTPGAHENGLAVSPDFQGFVHHDPCGISARREDQYPAGKKGVHGLLKVRKGGVWKAQKIAGGPNRRPP
jgi:hypothetical protein